MFRMEKTDWIHTSTFMISSLFIALEVLSLKRDSRIEKRFWNRAPENLPGVFSSLQNRSFIIDWV